MPTAEQLRPAVFVKPSRQRPVQAPLWRARPPDERDGARRRLGARVGRVPGLWCVGWKATLAPLPANGAPPRTAPCFEPLQVGRHPPPGAWARACGLAICAENSSPAAHGGPRFRPGPPAPGRPLPAHPMAPMAPGAPQARSSVSGGGEGETGAAKKIAKPAKSRLPSPPGFPIPPASPRRTAIAATAGAP